VIPLTPGEARLLATRARSTRARVRTVNALGQDVNLSSLQGYDWLVDATIREDVDQPTRTATLRLHRKNYHFNLSPFATDSALNNGGPLLDYERPLYIDVAVAPLDAEAHASDWINVFEGAIKNLDPAAGANVELVCRDAVSDLQQTWIEQETVYGSSEGVSLPVVMQQLLSDWFPTLTLHVPTDPGFMVRTYRQQKVSVYDALSQLALLIGWEVRMVFDRASARWRLTLREPPRDKAAHDFLFGPNDYTAIEQLQGSSDGVRNRVSGVFHNRLTGKVEDRMVEDQASIAKYSRFGRPRWMQFQEAASNGIDTPAEMNRLLTAALLDLREAKYQKRVSLPLFPWLELGDYYRFAPNGDHLSEALSVSVVSFEHKLSASKGVTSFEARVGRPVGAYKQWLLRERRFGVLERNQPGTDILPAPSSVSYATGVADVGQSTVSYVDVVWEAQPYATPTWFNVRYRLALPNAVFTVLSGVQGSSLRVQPLIAGRAYELQMQAENAGLQSDWSPLVQVVTAGDTDPPQTPVFKALQATAGGFLVELEPPVDADFKHFEIHYSLVAGFTPDPSSRNITRDTSRFFTGFDADIPVYVRAAAVDISGNRSGYTSEEEVIPISGEVAAGSIDITKLASTLRPPEIRVTRPTLPNSRYPVGVYIYVTGAVNKGLWRSIDTNADGVADTWQAAGTGELGAEGQFVAPRVIAGTIEAAAIGTQELAAEAVTAGKVKAGELRSSHLFIGERETTNLASNPNFYDSTATGWAGVTFISDSSFPQSKAGRLSQRDGYSGEEFPVTPGDEYFLSIKARATGPPNDYSFSVGMRWRLTDNTVVHHAAATADRTAAGVQEIQGYVKVPTNAVLGRVWVQNAGPSGPTNLEPWHFSELACLRVVDARAIINGELVLTSGVRQNARLVIKNAVNSDQVVLGAIAGRSGVPAGVGYGLWGEMGTGVFIKRVPRIHEFWAGTVNVAHPALAAGETANGSAFANFGRTVALEPNERLRFLLHVDSLGHHANLGIHSLILNPRFSVPGVGTVNGWVWDQPTAVTVSDIGVFAFAGFKALGGDVPAGNITRGVTLAMWKEQY
jgi:hypothetical protein